MSALEVVSVAANVALAVSCVTLIVRAHRAGVAASADRQLVLDEANAERRAAEAVHTEYHALGRSVAEALGEVRRDIDRNYQHTHEGHLLDRIAYQFEKVRGPIRLDAYLSEQIRSAGGERFISDGHLLYSGALNLAWHLHAEARKNAGELYVVTQESCGHTDRAAWLAKTLALYVRICNGDKDHAISSLDRVLNDWGYTDLHGAVRSTQATHP
jgi:hypothetical protein